ncbi:MAG: SH3 domain-containing protein [Cyanobacteria bacterium P01_H01_bin.21]
MITDLETKLSRRPMGWKQKQWCGLVLVPVIFLMLGSHVQAQQQVRSIQAPAPYNACNLRSGGGTQYSVLGTFRNGNSVTLLGESGRGWYRVQVGQQIGWLARQCLGL